MEWKIACEPNVIHVLTIASGYLPLSCRPLGTCFLSFPTRAVPPIFASIIACRTPPWQSTRPDTRKEAWSLRLRLEVSKVCENLAGRRVYVFPGQAGILCALCQSLVMTVVIEARQKWRTHKEGSFLRRLPLVHSRLVIMMGAHQPARAMYVRCRPEHGGTTWFGNGSFRCC